MLNIYDKMRVCERCEMLTALCCFVVVIRIVVCFFVCCNKSPCFGQNIGAFLKNQRERKEKRSNIVPRAMSQSKQESFSRNKNFIMSKVKPQISEPTPYVQCMYHPVAQRTLTKVP
jgi:hypothetical protein